MVNSKDIPKYLKENAKFCNWKYETRDGRLTKIPYNPHTNNKTSVNNANTFTDFNSVVNGLDINDKYYIKKNNVEVYVAGATNRFITITGNVLQKLDIAENLDGFQWLLETYMKRENSKTTIIQQERESYLTDESIYVLL